MNVREGSPEEVRKTKGSAKVEGDRGGMNGGSVPCRSINTCRELKLEHVQGT